MGTVNHGRDYHVLLRRLQVKLRQGLGLEDVVRPVQIVDDFSGLSIPHLPAIYGTTATCPAQGAAEYSGASLSTGAAGGIWLLWTSDASDNYNRVVIGADLIINNRAAVTTREIVAGDPNATVANTQCLLTRGSTNVAPPVGFNIKYLTMQWPPAPLYIPPGRFVNIVNGALNDVLNPTFMWAEVPVL